MGGRTGYLGVIITRSRAFKCSLHHAKKLFYRSANAIFGKIGRIASEAVVLHSGVISAKHWGI